MLLKVAKYPLGVRVGDKITPGWEPGPYTISIPKVHKVIHLQVLPAFTVSSLQISERQDCLGNFAFPWLSFHCFLKEPQGKWKKMLFKKTLTQAQADCQTEEITAPKARSPIKADVAAPPLLNVFAKLLTPEESQL